MHNNHIRIFFSINYNTVLGENVYVVGSIPELGNWDPLNSFPLNYHQGGTWSNALEIEKISMNIEYKYITRNLNTQEIRWEEGENRSLNLKHLKPSKEEIFNIEAWNHREVNIRLKYDCSSRKVMAVCGETQALGSWKNPIRMSLVSKKDPVSGARVTFWEKKFFVRHDVKKIKYRFVMLDDDEDTLTWEREPDRVCDFVTLNTLSPYKRFESNPNKKDCIKFARKNNRFVRVECNFVSEFCFDQITDNITIGPYPQNKTEIERLDQIKIKAVLNLQTRSDMKYRFLDWDELRSDYREKNIKVINYSILDMCAEDIKFKAYDGARLLYELVEKYGKVYVHCTAGIWRAPHIVAAYLNIYKGHSIEEAIQLIKEKRSVVYLSKELLQRAYKKHERMIKLTNLCFVEGNGHIANENNVAEGMNSENLAKKIITPDDNKGFQLGNSLKTRCGSGRNL